MNMRLICVFLNSFGMTMELYVAEEGQFFSFGYTNDTCLWDQFMTSFGLFMGFVTNKENMNSLQLSLY